MEDNKPPNKNTEPDNDLPQPSTSKPRHTPNKKSNTGDREPQQRKKKPFLEVWRAYSRVKQAEFVIASLAAIGVIGYLIAYISVSVIQKNEASRALQIEHAPLVINSRPPKLLQPFTCSPETGFHSGNIQTFVKNIGNARAINVNPHFSRMKIVPEKPTGDPFYDSRPEVNCDRNVRMPGLEFNLPQGVEYQTLTRQAVMTLPPLSKSSTVQLYYAQCVYYVDDYGANHGTCDTYVLQLPSKNPLDILSGSPTFVCDGEEKTGTFAGAMTGHCQKSNCQKPCHGKGD
jgi:hypothetical protein